MTTLAVAALSARVLVEAAHREGLGTIALDVFGDRDTLRATSQWHPIGCAEHLGIDHQLTLSALHTLAKQGQCAGWIAGSNFEGLPDLLTEGAGVLPLIGTAPDDVRKVKDHAVFFDLLSSHGIAHPATQGQPPANPQGWLRKDAHGSGGAHIHLARDVSTEPVSAAHYFQRLMPGTPMSATFLANGRQACILGFNDLIVRPVGGRSWVFCGAIGPVPPHETARRQITTAVTIITREMQLKGLCSLDFLLDGDTCTVLEVNPRPPASMALYADQAHQHIEGGLLAAHVRACSQGALPEWPPYASMSAQHGPRTHGFEIVFAPAGLEMREQTLDRLSIWSHCHDLPPQSTQFDPNNPVCTLSARGTDKQQVSARLNTRRKALLQKLETRT